MTDFTREWVAKREKLETAATEGPWFAEGRCLMHDVRYDDFEYRESLLEGTDGVDVTGWCEHWADAEFIADARTAFPAAVAALKAVLELHYPVEVEPSDTICGECSYQLPNGLYFGKVVEWPCPTVSAIETALRGES